MGRISAGTIIVGIFAVMFGLTGAFAVRKYLERPQEAVIPPRPPLPAPVPLSSIDLPEGKTIRLGDIMLVRMSPEQIKKRGLPPEYMTNTQQIIGRIVRTPMKKGEPFLTTALYPEGMIPSIADRLKPGFRAVTIPIKQDVGSLSGLALPGTHVDVLFRVSIDENGKKIPETTYLLLTDVEVLATGSNTLPGSANRASPLSVTLAVTPDQANKLKVVEGRGELSLAVRNGADNTLADASQGLTIDEVLGLPKKPEPVVVVPEKPFVTEIYRRGSRQVNSFDRSMLEQSFITPDPNAAGQGNQAPPADPNAVPANVNELK